MTARPTYRVSATRDSAGWWIVQALDFRHVVTQARRASDIEASARDVIAVLENVRADSFDLDVAFHVADDLDADVAEARRLRAEAAVLTAQSRAATSAVAHRLRSAGLTVRDIGALLDVAHQRAQQILSTPRRAAPRRRS